MDCIESPFQSLSAATSAALRIRPLRLAPRRRHRAIRRNPEIILKVTSSNDPVDLVEGEYDAGVQSGEFIQRDMIAVRVTKEMRLAVVGSPEYFKSNPIPKRPQDLKDHSCIGFRFSNGLYRWEFEKGEGTLPLAHKVPPPSTTGPCHSDCSAGSGDRHHNGSQSRGPDREGTLDTSAKGLVPFIPRILPLLPQSTQSARRPGGPDRHPSALHLTRDLRVFGLAFARHRDEWA